MIKIQVLGTGCSKCQKLMDQIEKAAQELGIEYKLEKITDLDKIMDLGVFMLPGLVVDGQMKATGNVPDIKSIKKLLLKDKG